MCSYAMGIMRTKRGFALAKRCVVMYYENMKQRCVHSTVFDEKVFLLCFIRNVAAYLLFGYCGPWIYLLSG